MQLIACKKRSIGVLLVLIMAFQAAGSGLSGEAVHSARHRLFLDRYRGSLVHAIRRLLRPNGTALIFAPLRGGTLSEFCGLAEGAGFSVGRYEEYDELVWDLHLKMRNRGKETYDENIHYPLLLTLTRSPSPAHLL